MTAVITSRGRGLLAGLAVLATASAALVGLGGTADAAPPAAFTTTNAGVDGDGHCANGLATGDPVNCNIYDGKQNVWLNGGPVGAQLAEGDYFFAVIAPGSQSTDGFLDGNVGLLSQDLVGERSFSADGSGAVTYSGTTHDVDSGKIRLLPYADTPNNGGVYTLAICKVPAGGYASTVEKDCKFDNFKVGDLVVAASPLTTSKTVEASYTTTYGWTVTKSVDKTSVVTSASSVTLNYTVTVTKSAGTISGTKLTGVVSVTNPNGGTVSGVTVTDALALADASAAPACTVSGGTDADVPPGTSTFPYTCAVAADAPLGSGTTNTVSVTWPDQLLLDGTFLSADSASYTTAPFDFVETKVDDSVTVTDAVTGGATTTLGTPSATQTYTYARTVATDPSACRTVDNTASFTTSTTAATGSASASSSVCTPLLGGKTIGFWQNKNGQAVITGAPQAPLRAFLTGYPPFQDLKATDTVAGYTTTVVKAANASGASMNAMLKAQMLATTLDVYFSDPALGGNKIGAPRPLGGVKVDLTQVCKMLYSPTTGSSTCSGTYVDSRPAFGVSAPAKGTTVSAMLAYAAGRSDVGGKTWYGNVKATQELAKNAFDAINNAAIAVTP